MQCNEREEMRGAPLSSDSAGATVSGTSKTELDLIWESGCSSSVLVERFSFCMLSPRRPEPMLASRPSSSSRRAG